VRQFVGLDHSPSAFNLGDGGGIETYESNGAKPFRQLFLRQL
jgi:hypothetical protein